MTVVIDPSHPQPNQPHPRACSCASCARARALRAKMRRVQRAQGTAAPRVDADLAARAGAHLRDVLAAVPHATASDVARACGLARSTVSALLGGRPGTAATARAVLALDSGTLTAAARACDSAQLVHTARTLEALGYPLPWQAEQTGHPIDRLVARHPGAVPTAALAAARALAARIGDTAATPTAGLTDEQITAARNAAHADGFYPPICYDEDTGQLIERALPDHRWTRCDDTAARRLSVLRRIMAGEPHAEVAEAVGVHRRNVQRISVWFTEHLDAADNAKAARDRLAHLLWLWDRGDVSATLTALRTGVLAQRAVAADHPDLAVWKAERPAEEPAPTAEPETPDEDDLTLAA